MLAERFNFEDLRGGLKEAGISTRGGVAGLPGKATILRYSRLPLVPGMCYDLDSAGSPVLGVIAPPLLSASNRPLVQALAVLLAGRVVRPRRALGLAASALRLTALVLPASVCPVYEITLSVVRSASRGQTDHCRSWLASTTPAPPVARSS